MRWENVADEKIVGANSTERRPAALSCDPGFCTPVLGRREAHRRVSHLQPHVTYYTRLHGMESEVIFWGGCCISCLLPTFHQAPSSRCIIGNQCKWMTTCCDTPPTDTEQFHSWSPTHFTHVLTLVPWLFYCSIVQVGGPERDPVASRGRSSASTSSSQRLWLDDQAGAGSLKCWVIFPNEDFCSFWG